MEIEKGYDPKSPESIYQFALKLYRKSLSEAVSIPEGIANSRNRGDLGSMVEKYFFKHVPPNNHEPDFAEAGVELKTTGVVVASNGKYKAKERLVLTMIDFNSLVNQEWETSTYLHKCKTMLILFYEYSKELPVEKRRFVLKPVLFQIPASDLPQFKEDWEKIRDKVREGRAHELSEGDTFLLAACRKGAGGAKESLRSQPYSQIKAPGRAFSIKPAYINRIVSGEINFKEPITDSEAKTFEAITANKFQRFIGKSIDEIGKDFGLSKSSRNQKNFKRTLAMKILGDGRSAVPLLKNSGITMKTITLNPNNLAKESMSFPAFDFLKIQDETWEESSFFENIESKFLFVIFKADKSGTERLVKVAYWNMPYNDRLEAQRVWLETQRRVSIDATNLPKISESYVAHVRPKARDGKDKYLTPQGTMHVKQCFWLNSRYISEVVKNLE